MVQRSNPDGTSNPDDSIRRMLLRAQTQSPKARASHQGGGYGVFDVRREMDGTIGSGVIDQHIESSVRAGLPQAVGGAA